jgi:hypothetical protein
MTTAYAGLNPLYLKGEERAQAMTVNPKYPEMPPYTALWNARENPERKNKETSFIKPS